MGRSACVHCESISLDGISVLLTFVLQYVHMLNLAHQKRHKAFMCKEFVNFFKARACCCVQACFGPDTKALNILNESHFEAKKVHLHIFESAASGLRARKENCGIHLQ